MQKMCSKRNMSFWTAFPLPCQPCETDLGRGLDPLTCPRGGLCQSTGGSLSSVPPPASPWGSPARALTKVGTYWAVLLPLLSSLIPLETASICLSCSAHNCCMWWQCIYSGIVTTSVRHVFTFTSKCLMERPAQSAWKSEAVDLANISDQCRTLQYSNMVQSV